MNTLYWSTNASGGDSYYVSYPWPTTGDDSYGSWWPYIYGNYFYKPTPALAPIAFTEKEVDLKDVLGWMMRGENIAKMAEIMKMMEEEINK